uniref:Transcriptional activator protein Pur-alpha n=1 Tax=Cacopsylla melanoneura TaxID=428564 RepID=A0A8D9F5I6_9HEMI
MRHSFPSTSMSAPREKLTPPHPANLPTFIERQTLNEQDNIMTKSRDFLKNILEHQFVRGDRVCMKNLFLHLSKAPTEVQKKCGRDIRDFKQFLTKFPETFSVKNNYVCLNLFKDESSPSKKLTIIENSASAQKAIEEISKFEEIGFKLHGCMYGLTGKISILAVIVPSGDIFLFDMIKYPTLFTATNLGSIFQSEEVLKVVHNCQNDSAALLGNHGIQLRKIFDLQCAFKTVQFTNPTMLDDSLTPGLLGLNNMLDFFEIRGNKLVDKDHAVKKMLKKNPNLWLERPLNQDFYELAASNVSHLLVLYGNIKSDPALRVNKVLFQNLVYEELFRFVKPLIIKRRQNVRQMSLRAWKRQMTVERRYISYTERSNGKDQIWRNDYSIPSQLTAKLNSNSQRSNRTNDDPYANHITDLDTKFFVSNNKRYYFDIKEQKDVKFVKISEISETDGSRNLISINLNLVPKFRDCLLEIQHFRKPNGRDLSGRGTTVVHGLSIVKDTRRYLVDLKRNYRGYFVTISQMLPTGGKLSSIAFGLRDLSTFIEIFYDIGQEFNITEDQISDGSYLRYRNKRYFFNVNQNQNGTFMRISEVVSPNYQATMTVPEKCWDNFIKKFTETVALQKSTKMEVGDANVSRAKAGSYESGDDNVRTKARSDESGDANARTKVASHEGRDANARTKMASYEGRDANARTKNGSYEDGDASARTKVGSYEGK